MEYIFQVSLSMDNGLVYIYTYALSAVDRVCELQMGVLSIDNELVHVYTHALSIDN